MGVVGLHRDEALIHGVSPYFSRSSEVLLSVVVLASVSQNQHLNIISWSRNPGQARDAVAPRCPWLVRRSSMYRTACTGFPRRLFVFRNIVLHLHRTSHKCYFYKSNFCILRYT